MGGLGEGCGMCPAVVPVLVGPLQVLLTILPGLLGALGVAVLALFKPSGFKNAVMLLWRQKFAVGVVVVLGVAAYFGASHWWPRGQAGDVSALQAGSDWPTARGDLTRCGALPDSASPGRRDLIWSYRDGGEGFLASPAIVGNRLYIASARLGISQSGFIYCVDATTGALVWKSAPPNFRPTFSSPVVAGDYLVCGEGLHFTRDARVICLDVKNDGKVLWTFRTNNHVECTPVVANGRVYVGAGDDGYYCLDLKPGADGQAVVHWHLPGDKYPDAETSLAVHDGKVYAGLGNTGAALVVLDALTGNELQRIKMPYPVFSPASIAGGKLYVGMGNGDYVGSGEGGAVHCLDLKTLKTDWTYELAQTVLGAVAIKDDKLYFGSSDGQLYCLSRAGKLIKTFDAGSPIKTSPAVTDAHVFVVCDAGELFVLDRHTLEPVWNFRLGTAGMFYSSPLVAHGHVYVGTEKDGLMCLGKAASTERIALWASPLGGPGVAGNSDKSPVPESGEVQWMYPEKPGDSIAAPVAVWDEHVYVARTGKETRGLECLALAKDGKKPTRAVWSFRTEADVETSPVVSGNSVACIDGLKGSSDRQLYILDRMSGELLARHSVIPSKDKIPAPNMLTATRHQYLVQIDRETLTSFDDHGAKQWSAAVGRLHVAPAANDAMVLVVAEVPAQALALDRATGTELWRIPLPQPATATPLLETKKFLLPTTDGLEARSLVDGQVLTSWTTEVGAPSSELAAQDSFIVFVNQQGELVVFDRTARKTITRLPGALPGQTPLISRDKILYAATGRLMMLTLGADNPPELWIDLSMTARKDALPCGAIILKDARLLTTLPGRGLACLGAAHRSDQKRRCMRWVFSFAERLPPQEGDAKHVLGGKGASLQEMTRAGLQVPPGFTLRTECCQHYFDNQHRWPDDLEAQIREHLSRLEQTTGRTFGRGPKPLLVSVRSGAVVSMPGMMDTLLNCGLTPRLADDLGNPPWYWPRYLQFIRMFARTVDGLKDFASVLNNGKPADRSDVDQVLLEYQLQTGKPFPQEPWDLLVACINAVFASWQSERAVAYRQRHDLRGVNGTAVNVQAMWPSEVSGICFTQDPTSAKANRVVIEAAYGLGEAVVSGDVHPDRFLVPRDRPEQVETHLGRKVTHVPAFGADQQRDPDAASLAPPQVRELFDLALKIERHFGHPVDLEWGWTDGRFALLQARPIRGLDVAEHVEQVRREEFARLKELAGGKRKLWIAHNLGETLRTPTPMTWDIMRHFMSGQGGFGRMYQKLGYRPSKRVCREGFLDLICGRIYADPDRLSELFWEGMPLTYDLDALAQDKTILDRAPAKFDASKADALFLLRLPKILWDMWRSSRRMQWHRRCFLEIFEDDVLPTYLEDVDETGAQELTARSDAELIEELDARCRNVLDEFGPASLLPGFFGGLAFDALEAQLVQLVGRQQGVALAGTLTLALDGDMTFEQDELLYEVAGGRATLADFLERFGHRCVGEMELATPRWRENPAYLEQTLARLRANPGRPPGLIHQDNVARRQQAEHALPKILAEAGGSSLREDIEATLAQARALLPYRETGKYYLMMGYELIRQVLEEFGRRWDLGGDIYFLQRAELTRFSSDSPTLRATIQERKRRWQLMKRLDAPEIVDSENLDSLGLPPPIEAADELTGTAMAPGIATGVARIVADPQSAGELGTDYVLVCASTDPGWTPLFLNARGLVVERGGVLSHGAIVARDFGIPAVACPHATQQLHDGDLVRVDGDQGRVFVVERRSGHA